MAALLGRIDSFDPELEEWSQYVERIKQRSDVLPFSHWANALQVIAKPHSSHEAHRQDVRRASCRPYRTLQSTAVRGHATVPF